MSAPSARHRATYHWRCVCNRPVIATTAWLWLAINAALAVAALFGGLHWRFGSVLDVVATVLFAGWGVQEANKIVDSARHRSCPHRRARKALRELPTAAENPARPDAH